MHYVCIEDNKIISILNYVPSVPNTVSVVTITDDQHQQLLNQTHVFDIASRQVVPVATNVLNQRTLDVQNAQEREFLNSTDWKVLRHIREKALGNPTSLTESEYLNLERQRAAAAARIVEQ